MTMASVQVDTPVARRLASVKNIIIVLSGKGMSLTCPHIVGLTCKGESVNLLPRCSSPSPS